MKKKFSILLVTVFMVSCAATKYQWVNKNGNDIPESRLAAIKSQCNWDKKIQQARNKWATSIQVSRYERYDDSKSEKLRKEGNKISQEAQSCMNAKGVIRKKPKT